VRAVIGPRAKLVSIMHVSNVLGVINPIADIAEMAHAVGAKVLVDGAQSAPQMPVDVEALGWTSLRTRRTRRTGRRAWGAVGAGESWRRWSHSWAGAR
jgi:cysteine desulfurase/selenocysteine lyase